MMNSFSLMKVLFRLRQAVVTYQSHTRALRVPVGELGRQVLRTCPWTVLQTRCHCSGQRRHRGWDDVVQGERQVTISAQSQVSSTVPTISRRTRQQWTGACPQRHRWPSTRFVNILTSRVNRANKAVCIAYKWSSVNAVLFFKRFDKLNISNETEPQLMIRDVKASRPMWPRGQIIWPRPQPRLHSFWPRPRSRPHSIWPGPHRNWPRGLEYLQCTWH